MCHVDIESWSSLKHTSWYCVHWFAIDWLRTCVHVDIDSWYCPHWLGIDGLRDCVCFDIDSWACVHVDIDSWDHAHRFGIDQLRACVRFDIDSWACFRVDIDSWKFLPGLIQIWKQFPRNHVTFLTKFRFLFRFCTVSVITWNLTLHNVSEPYLKHFWIPIQIVC